MSEPHGAMARADEIPVPRWPSERPLFAVVVVASILIWLLLVVSIIGIVYVGLIGLFFLVMHDGATVGAEHPVRAPVSHVAPPNGHHKYERACSTLDLRDLRREGAGQRRERLLASSSTTRIDRFIESAG